MLAGDLQRLETALSELAVRHKLHADDRPHARHPRRADHLRPQVWPSGWRRSAATAAPGCRAPRDARSARSPARSARTPTCRPNVEELRLRAAWPARRRGLRPRSCSATATRTSSARWPSIAATLEKMATEIRHLQRTEVGEAGRAVRGRPAGLVVDAAQAQPRAGRAHLRPGPAGARVRGHACPGERRPLARARHQPLVGRADHPARTPASRSTTCCDVFTDIVDGLDVFPDRDAAQPGLHPRAGLLGAGAAGAGRGGAWADEALPDRPGRTRKQVWAGEGDLRALLAADPRVTIA